MFGFFTFHTYKSWMPDRDEGYQRRNEGHLPRDVEMSDLYGRNSKENGFVFDEAMQRAAIEAILEAAKFQSLKIHAIGTESTHIHIVAEWTKDADLMKVGEGLKSSITRALNKRFGKRTWLSDGASRRQVIAEAYYVELIDEYIPKHCGVKWRVDMGYH